MMVLADASTFNDDESWKAVGMAKVMVDVEASDTNDDVWRLVPESERVEPDTMTEAVLLMEPEPNEATAPETAETTPLPVRT